MKKNTAILLALSLFVAPMQIVPVAEAASSDVLYSVVQIYSYKEYGDEYLLMGSGSGSIISEDGIILTNYHVISDENGEPLDDFEICFLMNEYEAPICDEYAYPITYDAEADLALLYPYVRYDFETEDWEMRPEDDEMWYPPVTFAATSYDSADLPALRDEVSIVGYPASSLTETISITTGQITSFSSIYNEELDESFVYRMETDAIVNPGNSGGAAFDKNDRFVGIPTEISMDGISGQYGYIVPVTFINAWLDYLVEEEFLAYNPNQYVYGSTQMALEDALVAGAVTYEDADLSQFDQDAKLFLDLSMTHPNYAAIEYLKQNKIIGGYPDGTFRPEGEITRAELMKILALSSGSTPDPEQYNNCFPDVADDWYAKYVCYGKEQGWVEGYPDGTFQPGNQVVKAEAIKMVLNTQGVIVEQIVAENPFSDVSQDAWFAKYVITAKNLGILEEEGILYKPADNATRSGVSENIYRVVK
jgi:Trypsin-like peptidase domain/S-layer homology domain